MDPDSVAILSYLFTSVFRIRIGSGFCSELNCVCQCFGSGLNWVSGSVSGIPQAGQTRPQKQPKNEDILCLNFEELSGSFSISLRVLFMGSEEIYGILRSNFFKPKFVLQIFVSKNLHLNPDRIRRLQSPDPNKVSLHSKHWFFKSIFKSNHK